MVIDLHVVAPADAGALDSLLSACARAGLDGVCLLGAGEVPPVAEARAAAASAGVAVFFGVEISLEKGRLIWVPRELSALQSGEWKEPLARNPTPDAVRAIATELGGVVIAAHPYDRSTGPSFSDGIYQLPFVHAIEVANHGMFQVRNHMAIDAATRLKVTAVGGTGSSDASLLGRAATVFLRPVNGQADLVDAIVRGDVWGVEFLAEVEAPEPEGRHDRGGRERGDAERGGRGGRGTGDRERDRGRDRAPGPQAGARPARAEGGPAAQGEGAEAHRRRRRRRRGRGGHGEGGQPGGGPEAGGGGQPGQAPQPGPGGQED